MVKNSQEYNHAYYKTNTDKWKAYRKVMRYCNVCDKSYRNGYFSKHYVTNLHRSKLKHAETTCEINNLKEQIAQLQESH